MAAPSSILVIGGQRSGKSRYAEGLVAASGLRPVYLATATAGDGEMAARIAAHRARRGDGWRTVEEPLELTAALERVSRSDSAVLVECLTLWLTNLMAAGRPVAEESGRLVTALGRLAGPVVIVTNEVGWGIVPDNALSRCFADELGTLNRRVAEVADRVVLVAAGLPMTLKPAVPEHLS